MPRDNIVSERTKKMRENFIKERREGKSFTEIAQKYGLHVTTIYMNLQAIADENSVSRESLLYRPSSSHVFTKPRGALKKDDVDPNELKNRFSEIKKNTQSIIEKIDEKIEEIVEEELQNEWYNAAKTGWKKT